MFGAFYKSYRELQGCSFPGPPPELSVELLRDAVARVTYAPMGDPINALVYRVDLNRDPSLVC